MWILSKKGNGIINSNQGIVNSNQVKSFSITYSSYDEYILWADSIVIGTFMTKDEAKKELLQIYNALVSGQDSYSVG